MMIQPIQHDILDVRKTYRKNEIMIFNQGGGEWETTLSDKTIQSHSTDIPNGFRYQTLETLIGDVTEIIHVEEMGDSLVVRSGPKMAFLKDLPSGLLRQYKEAETAAQEAVNKLTTALSQAGGSTRQHQENLTNTKRHFDSVALKCIQNSVDEALEYFQEETQLHGSVEYDDYGVRIQDPSPHRRKNQITVNSRNTPPPRRNRSRSRSRSRERQQRRRRTPSREREELRDRRRGRRRPRSTRFHEHSHRSEPRPRRTNARMTDPQNIGREYSRTPNPPSRVSISAFQTTDRLLSSNLEASIRAIDASAEAGNGTGERLVDLGGQLISDLVSGLLDGQETQNSGVSRALETQELGGEVVESLLDREN